MANYLIIGGHGKVALLLAPLLVAEGHQVTAVIRDPAQAADVEATGATPLVLSIENADVDQIVAALDGIDAVVWSAGAGGGSPARTYAVDRDAAIRSMRAAENAGVERYVMVSYANARADHGVDRSNGFFHYAEAKAAADDFLRGTSLDWTIVGPGALTLDDPSGTIAIIHATDDGGETSRANVAAVVAAVLADPETIGATIRFTDGAEPIADAIRRGERP